LPKRTVTMPRAPWRGQRTSGSNSCSACTGSRQARCASASNEVPGSVTPYFMGIEGELPLVEDAVPRGSSRLLARPLATAPAVQSASPLREKL
jgi:hypothetical protein